MLRSGRSPGRAASSGKLGVITGSDTCAGACAGGNGGNGAARGWEYVPSLKGFLICSRVTPFPPWAGGGGGGSCFFRCRSMGFC